MDPRSITCKLGSCKCPQGVYGIHLPAATPAPKPTKEKKSIQWSARPNSIIPRPPTPPPSITPNTSNMIKITLTTVKQSPASTQQKATGSSKSVPHRFPVPQQRPGGRVPPSAPQPAPSTVKSTTTTKPCPCCNATDPALCATLRKTQREAYIFSVRSQRSQKERNYLSHPEQYYQGEMLKKVRKAIEGYREARNGGDGELVQRKYKEWVVMCGLVPTPKQAVDVPDHLKE